jgi:hypothetical protein
MDRERRAGRDLEPALPGAGEVRLCGRRSREGRRKQQRMEQRLHRSPPLEVCACRSIIPRAAPRRDRRAPCATTAAQS